MATYTADAVALLAYLVDALPQEADRVFGASEAGETVVETPSTALAEALYAVSRDKNVRGTTLATPEEVRRTLTGGPVSVAPVDDEALAEYTQLVGEFSTHDGLIVASHRARETEAIVTTDSVVREAGYDTVWE